MYIIFIKPVFLPFVDFSLAEGHPWVREICHYQFLVYLRQFLAATHPATDAGAAGTGGGLSINMATLAGPAAAASATSPYVVVDDL